MQNVNVPVAFFGGVFSFLSPCFLPLVPGYVCFLTGLSIEQLKDPSEDSGITRQVFVSSLFFIAGFSLVFIALGAAASYVGFFLASHKIAINRIAGVLLVFLGLYLTGVLRIRKLDLSRKVQPKRQATGKFGAWMVGVIFALGWTPCAGPILAGILALAATEATVTKGVFLLFAYSLGIAIPFLLTALAISRFMKFLKKYGKWIKWVQFIAGIVLVMVGVLIFMDELTRLIVFVPELFNYFAK